MGLIIKKQYVFFKWKTRKYYETNEKEKRQNDPTKDPKRKNSKKPQVSTLHAN